MKRISPWFFCVWFVSTPALAGEAADERAHSWHRWRGPLANGVAPYGNPPVEWDEQTNIKWKVEIPGLGNSTPIIWNNQIFILTAIKTDRTAEATAQTASKPTEQQQEREAAPPERRSTEREADRPEGASDEPRRRSRRRRGGRRRRGPPPKNIYQFVVMSIDRATGNVNWKRTANEQVPHEGFRQGDNSFASGSPTTDGRYLYASFGSYGIYCYDLEGEPIWQRDLGDMRTRNSFGEGASPTLHGDRLIVNWDHEGDSFIVSLDAKTGDTRWKVSRDEPSSWATPLVIEHQERTQVIVNGTNRVRSYDLANGEVIWECGGQTVNVIPTPVASDGIVVCMTGFRGSAIFAIPLDATGDLTGSDKLAWYHDGTTPYRPGSPYTPSPLLDGNLLYFLKSNNPIVSCLMFKSGEVVFDNQRLQGLRGVYASPVAAAEHIYIVGRNGTTAVLKRGDQFELLATNVLDDPIDASPAVVGNELFLRSKQQLYCIASE